MGRPSERPPASHRSRPATLTNESALYKSDRKRRINPDDLLPITITATQAVASSRESSLAAITEDRATRLIASRLRWGRSRFPLFLPPRNGAAARAIMTIDFRLYRGLEIQPLVYPHHAAEAGRGHNYEQGFDAAVLIQQQNALNGVTRSRVFKLGSIRPFEYAGDARRASTAYAERLIDTCYPGSSILDQEP